MGTFCPLNMDNSGGQENLFKYVNFESLSPQASSRMCFLKEISDNFLFPFTFRGHFNWVSQNEKTRATANESSGNFHRQPLRTLNRNTQTNKTPFYIKWEDEAGFSNKPSPYWSRPELSQNTFDTELTNYADTYPPSTMPCFGRKKRWFGVKNPLGNPQVATRPIFALTKWECPEAGRYSNFLRWQIYVINTVDSTTLPLYEIAVELFHSQEWPKRIFSLQCQYIFIRKAMRR